MQNGDSIDGSPECSPPVSCTIHSVAVQTASFQDAYSFYKDILGLRVVREPFKFKTRTLAWLDAGPALIELYSAKSGTEPRPYSPDAVGIDHIAFVVSNLDAMAQYLAAKGVKILKGPFVPPSGDPAQPRILFVEGPDGEELQFREAAKAGAR